MNTKGSDYRAYLLRLWKAEENGKLLVRCTLEESMTGQRLTFANLEAMTAYLRKKLGVNEEE